MFRHRHLSSAIAVAVCLLGMVQLKAQPLLQTDVDEDVVDLSTPVAAGTWEMPDDLTMRARIVSLKPRTPSGISWRYGGEGLGGSVTRGSFTGPDGDVLKVGQWSQPLVVRSLAGKRFPRQMFLTITGGDPGRIRSREDRTRIEYSTDVVFEFEFSHGRKVIKTIREVGPDGGTVGLVINADRLADGRTPSDPLFVNEGILSLSQYAEQRMQLAEAQPWIGGPLPKKFTIINNIGGLGSATGHGVRHTNAQIIEYEVRALRTLGTNGFRSAPDFLSELVRKREGYAAAYTRGVIDHVMGFPVVPYREGRTEEPDSGCPFGLRVAELTAEAVKHSLEKALSNPVDEVWGLTVDEIGTVIDKTPEKKAHLSVCPACAIAYRDFLKAQNLSPADVGFENWQDVRPLNVWGGPNEPQPWRTNPAAALNAYQTRQFNNYATAKLFTPLRDAFNDANDAKRRAITEGRLDSPEAKQPWLYSFALRGNTFLMRSHSLDFFEFYRHADNALVYETSNRDPRIWQWDSYLSDVGRVVSEDQNIAFGIYVKPHRGAPVQRGLSAAARGTKMIYWYTYGPDYAKGDTFSHRPDVMATTSKGAHLLGKAEDVLYDAKWMKPAEVAIVKPFSLGIWMGLSGDPAYMAAWENAKWTYSALAHAHVPLDPIDEGLLETRDLSRYKVIYVLSPVLRQASAEKLAAWVEAGGTLYTSGFGLVADEANQNSMLWRRVLGLESRYSPELWRTVQAYGATALQRFDNPKDELAPVPEGMAVVGEGLFAGQTTPLVVGREVLSPVSEAKVLARYSDGGVAAISHSYGKGTAYTIGFYAGLEYSAPLRAETYDMSQDFPAAARAFVAAPALQHVQPPVTVGHPLVEPVLLKHPQTGVRSIVLMNWAYRVDGQREHVVARDVELSIHDAGAIRSVRSTILDRELPITTQGDVVTVTLPVLEEADVLVLD